RSRLGFRNEAVERLRALLAKRHHHWGNGDQLRLALVVDAGAAIRHRLHRMDWDRRSGRVRRWRGGVGRVADAHARPGGAADRGRLGADEAVEPKLSQTVRAPDRPRTKWW